MNQNVKEALHRIADVIHDGDTSVGISYEKDGKVCSVSFSSTNGIASVSYSEYQKAQSQ